MAEVSEKVAKAREERRNQFLSWNIEEELPKEIGQYKLKRFDRQDNRIYYAFGWVGQENAWIIYVLFDEETMDYMVKMDLSLFTLSEIELITGDFDAFKRNVRELTPHAIEKELIEREKVSVLVQDKGFMNWDYEEYLPKVLGQYKRVIEPKRPILGLNGSYIIGAYECKEKETGILFFYNMYREEYYGELRAKGIPGIVHQYDAKNIDDFEKVLRANLENDLSHLYENPELEA